MTNESYISTLEPEADEEICELPGSTVGRPCEVAKLKLPLDSADFADEEFRKSFSSSYVLGFLPACNYAPSARAKSCRKRIWGRSWRRARTLSPAWKKVDNRALNIGTAIKIGGSPGPAFLSRTGETYSELLSQVARTELRLRRHSY